MDLLAARTDPFRALAFVFTRALRRPSTARGGDFASGVPTFRGFCFRGMFENSTGGGRESTRRGANDAPRQRFDSLTDAIFEREVDAYGANRRARRLDVDSRE
jgi:hypothetical protein